MQIMWDFDRRLWFQKRLWSQRCFSIRLLFQWYSWISAPKWLFYLEQNRTYCGGPWTFIIQVQLWNNSYQVLQCESEMPPGCILNTCSPQLFSGGWRLWEVIGGRSMELANSVHFLPYALLPGLLWREQTDTYSCSHDPNHSLCLPCHGR